MLYLCVSTHNEVLTIKRKESYTDDEKDDDQEESNYSYIDKEKLRLCLNLRPCFGCNIKDLDHVDVKYQIKMHTRLG